MLETTSPVWKSALSWRSDYPIKQIKLSKVRDASGPVQVDKYKDSSGNR